MSSRRVIFVPDDYWTNPPEENHMNDERDLSEGFPDYPRPPRDIVGPTALDPSAPPIPTGLTAVTSYEITDTGITRTEETVFVGRAITPDTLRNRKEYPHD